MGLTSREIVEIVQLIFYTPALITSILVCRKHGAGRQLGWIYLAILSILRLIGASTGIAAVYDPNTSLIACTITCSSIGLSPLLLALQCLLKRINEGMKGQGLRLMIIQIWQIPILVALILSIIAGTRLYSTDPSTQNSGYTFSEAGIVLFVASYVALAGITLATLTKRRHILEGETRLLAACLLSLPFIGVRLLYSVIADFDHHSTVFSLISDSHTAVIVWAIMNVLMEFVAVTTFLLAGIFVRVIPRSMVKAGYVDPPSYNAVTQKRSTAPGNYDKSSAYPLSERQSGSNRAVPYGNTTAV